MALTFDLENNWLRFDIPNSEANINAQHCGIKDRSVGSYYMSEQLNDCLSFLSNFDGEFFIDLALCYLNGQKIITRLKELRYEGAFKERLVPQIAALGALEWQISNGDYFHSIPEPAVNDQGKYLRLDNNDEMIQIIKTLMLGDLTSLYIKRLGQNGYVIYFDQCPQFEESVVGTKVLSWME